MSETIKTLVFVVTAGVLGLAAWIVAPRTISEARQQQIVGSPLFPSFSDPTAAKKMEIVRFDEKLAAIVPFSVEYRNGAWRLPSRNDYPADAEAQMSKAANLLIGMEVLSEVTDLSSVHATYGVIDPDSKGLQAGVTGVGKRVNLYDGSGNKLAEVIVGDEMKNSPGIYYVRHGGPGRNQVYTVKMDAKVLTTNFSDWIEKDLLKLDAFSIRELELKDYESQGGIQDNQLVASVANRSQSVVKYDGKKGEWSLAGLKKFDDASSTWVDDPLESGEELNTQTLNDVRYALDDLKIVDVVRKPAKLGADLRADKAMMNDIETVSDLLSRGFLPYVDPSNPEQTEILSENGEFICRMESGVEYILRFGKTVNTVISEDSTENKEGADEEKGEDRYLMVAARFNPDLIEKPVMEPVPQTIEDLKKPKTSGGDAQGGSAAPSAPDVKAPVEGGKAAAPSTDGAASGEPALEAPAVNGDAGGDAAQSQEAAQSEEATQSQGAAQEATSAQPETTPPTDEAQPPSPEPAAPSEAATPAEPATQTEGSQSQPSESEAIPQTPPAGQPSLQNSPQEPDPAGAAAPEAQDGATTGNASGASTESAIPQTAPIANVEQAQLIAAQEKITKANAEKQKDYEKKLKDGQDKVKELNDRFADWYYIISDNVFKKIRLGRSDIIKMKQAEPETGAAQGFQGLPPGINIPGLGN